MDFVAGDTNSLLVVVCRDQNGEIINLTDYTVTLRWRYIPNGPMVKKVTMTNDDQTATPGQCYYRWGPGELIAPNIYYDCVIRENAFGRFVTQIDEVALNIRPKAEDPDISSSPSASRSPSSSPSASSSSSPSSSTSASPSSSTSASPSAS